MTTGRPRPVVWAGGASLVEGAGSGTGATVAQTAGAMVARESEGASKVTCHEPMDWVPDHEAGDCHVLKALRRPAMAEL